MIYKYTKLSYGFKAFKSELLNLVVRLISAVYFMEQLEIPEDVMTYDYCSSLYDRATSLGIFGVYSMNRNVIYYIIVRFYEDEQYLVLGDNYFDKLRVLIYDYRFQEMLYGFPIIVNRLALILINKYSGTIYNLIETESKNNFNLLVAYYCIASAFLMAGIVMIGMDIKMKLELSFAILIPHPEYTSNNILFVNQFKKYYNEN